MDGPGLAAGFVFLSPTDALREWKSWENGKPRAEVPESEQFRVPIVCVAAGKSALDNTILLLLPRLCVGNTNWGYRALRRWKAFERC